MNDSAISYSSNGSMSVDTYGMDGSAVGTNDFGQLFEEYLRLR